MRKTTVQKIGYNLGRMTMWSIYLIAFIVILSNWVQLELFTNGICSGLSVFIPHELYEIIGHGQAISDMHVIDNFYICVDCN